VAHALREDTLGQFGVLGHEVRLERALLVEELCLHLLLALFPLLGFFIELQELLVFLVLTDWAQGC
jgi:hypothetical protein